MKNTNSFHFNTKPQILKSLLFYREARPQSTWECALIYLVALSRQVQCNKDG